MIDETTAPETRQGASDGLSGGGVGDSLAGEVEALARLFGEHADWDTDYIGGTYSTFCICGHPLPDVESGEAHREHVARAVLAAGYRREVQR